MKTPEYKWGLIIGGAYLIWLYLSYFLGMHTNGLGLLQIMGLISLAITFVGFVLGLRAVQKEVPEISWGEGVKSGAIIAGIAAVVAIVAQFGYFTLIHPDFPEYMGEETKQYFAGKGLSQEELDAAVEAAETTFSMKAYMVKAAAGMFLIGVIFSTIIMAFLRRLAK